MELGIEELPAHEITAAIGAARQPLYYLAPGCVGVEASMRPSRVPIRVMLIPRLGQLAQLQAAQQTWCAAAELALGDRVGRIDAEVLLRPPPGSRWQAASAQLRAGLLRRAIELVAEHATELAVLDEEELGARVDGVSMEYIFLGLAAHRAEREDVEVMLLGPGGEDRWLLRTLFTTHGRTWRRGVVLAPTGALAGVELAAVAARVILWEHARMQGERSEEPAAQTQDGAGQLASTLDPALAAALRAGAMMLTRRVVSLIPASGESLLH